MSEIKGVLTFGQSDFSYFEVYYTVLALVNVELHWFLLIA